MRFFTEHFTIHHLRHAPHRWFTALILSPIHAAEVYYKRKYHLNFVHAKKLFALDMILFATMLILTGATIFWFSYKPRTADLVTLSITAPSDRLLSGQELTYTVFYQNNNPFTLHAPRLKISLPASFLVSRIEPSPLEGNESALFNLPDLAHNDSGVLTITGRLYQTPQQETTVVARLSYQGAGRKIREEVIGRTITITRGSILKLTLQAPEVMLNQSTAPMTIILENTGAVPISNIKLPLATPTGLWLQSITADQKTIQDNQWHAPPLQPGATYQLKAQLKTDVRDVVTELALSLTPQITVGNLSFPQATVEHRLKILHPKATISAVWDGKPTVQPGASKFLQLEIKNQGSIPLQEAIVTIALPRDVVNATSGQLVISSAQNPALQYLDAGDIVHLTVPIYIRPEPLGGTDLTLTLTPRLKARVKEVPDGLYTITASSPPMAIGTYLNLSAKLIYYTTEGDQLGRGPLPPQAGKETKYWTTSEIRNTTSRVKNLILSARLAPGADWTGRTSVNQGEPPSFNHVTRTVTWQIPVLNPHEHVAINFEFAFTPTPEERGQMPVVIENLTLTGEDMYINETIRKERGSLNVSLPDDVFAQKRGVVVE